MGLPRYRQLLDILPDDLEEDAALRAPLVQLTSGVEEAGPDAQHGRDAEPVAEDGSNPLERPYNRSARVHVGEDGEIVVRPHQLEHRLEWRDRSVGRSCQRLGGRELRYGDVRLVERIQVEQHAGKGGGELPAEYLPAEVDDLVERELDERVLGGELVSAGQRTKRDEHAIVAVHVEGLRGG